MSTELPQLPEARGVGIVYGGGPYEPEWTSHQDAYDEDDMRSYAQAYAQPAVEALRIAVESDLGRLWRWPDSARVQWMKDAREVLALYEKDKP